MKIIICIHSHIIIMQPKESTVYHMYTQTLLKVIPKDYVIKSLDYNFMVCNLNCNMLPKV